MKKSLLALWMAVLALAFTGCKDDDDTPLIPSTDLNATFGSNEDAKLILKYGESTLTGKQVKFYTKDSKKATITLQDVIPGESEVILDDIQLVEGNEEYLFNGNTVVTRAAGVKVQYSGSIKKGMLTLHLNVVLPGADSWAKTYRLSDYTVGTDTTYDKIALTGSAYFQWGHEDTWCSVFFPSGIRAVSSMILPQVLKTITLEPDGNICAQYSSNDLQVDQELITKVFMAGIIPTTDYVNSLIPASGWVQSPRNLAYWFQKDNKLYVKLDVPAIVAQVLSDSSSMADNQMLGTIINTVLNGNAASVKALLKQFLGIDFSTISDATFDMLLDWIKNGIPMNVNEVNGHTYIYLDKTMLDPIFVDNESEESEIGMNSDIIKLFLLLYSKGIIPEDASPMAILLQGISTSWPATVSFDLGLDLTE